ncbi:MAG: YaaA family protein, partial [Muribaculaceae bacterium]|nr:YaaA family protein [Muribaculaceae bacterium]
MIVLIAESKTMTDREMTVSRSEYEAQRPAGECSAAEIMNRVAGMSAGEIAQVMKVSAAMAAKVLRMAYEFPNKLSGLRAIEAFTGVVFKSFDYSSLTPGEKKRCASCVRIISSLYGWLEPENIIKPYRFDFTTRLAPGGKSLAEYLRKDVTIQLVKELQSGGETAILNLLPADAGKCIDWKLVKRFFKVWKVDFKELKDGGEWKTPNAGKLKSLRGELLRTIISRNLTEAADLLTLETDNLMPLATPDYPD